MGGLPPPPAAPGHRGSTQNTNLSDRGGGRPGGGDPGRDKEEESQAGPRIGNSCRPAGLDVNKLLLLRRSVTDTAVVTMAGVDSRTEE